MRAAACSLVSAVLTAAAFMPSLAASAEASMAALESSTMETAEADWASRSDTSAVNLTTISSSDMSASVQVRRLLLEQHRRELLRRHVIQFRPAAAAIGIRWVLEEFYLFPAVGDAEARTEHVLDHLPQWRILSPFRHQVRHVLPGQLPQNLRRLPPRGGV